MSIPISVFIKIAGKQTIKLLEEILPQIGGKDWWQDCVVGKLSYQQQQLVTKGEVSGLTDLDFAAAIRVLEKNWYEVADKAGFLNNKKTLVRQMADMRHRLAHESVSRKQSANDRYRDLDTLKRYLEMLKADADTLSKLDAELQACLARLAGQTPPAGPPPAPSPSTPPPGTTPPADKAASIEAPRGGVPLELLGPEAASNPEITRLLAARTYIGIDFGTSTTTVSRVVLDEETGSLSSEPIPIKQYDESGTCTEDHLVPSCIAWTGSRLLIGQGAARLKSEYEYGRNIWFSFKMKLGIDLGPQYYRSELAHGLAGRPCVIEKPQQAATVFFRYLREQLEEYVKERNLPSEIVYSVSVPASFEANQRQDLVNALCAAGIELPTQGIIDEPNAAFISYLLDQLRDGTAVADFLRDHRRNVLVFDFGAGTCDISVLQVGGDNEGRFVSRNLAISQFHALGGDNIDRHIVRELLLPQLIAQSKPSFEFTTAELEQVIIPRLQQTAEDMKRQCCKIISNNWDRRNIEPFISSERKITGKPVPAFRIRDCELRLDAPCMTFQQFAQVMAPFLMDENAADEGPEDTLSIFEPLQSALDKADLTADNLHMILFIGGSSLNPFVQHAIKTRYGRFVECYIPGDTRTPVSRGAAMHAFMLSGLNCEVIRPITSEPIYLITVGGGLHLLLPAGTEIPSEPTFVSDLIVQHDGQTKVELPICVTNEDKLLGTVVITAPAATPFKAGNSITLMCRLDDNKLLSIQAKVGRQMVTAALLNPLSNEPQTPEQTRMLLARQAVNISALENRGRPSAISMLAYAYACMEAEQFLLAAEAFENVERLDPKRDFAVTITYCYSRADRPHATSKWSEEAFRRNPTPTAAFNLALTHLDNKDIAGYERLMEQAITMDPSCAFALESYGHHLKQKGNPRGLAMLETAFEQYNEAFEAKNMGENDYSRLIRVARTLGRTDVVARVERRRKDSAKSPKLYSEKNLAVSTRQVEGQMKGA